MSSREYAPIGELIDYSAGGGWGSEEPEPNYLRVAVIRGADFPGVSRGEFSSVPIRWERKEKVKKVSLRPGDIILENSGGTKDRPTGRTVLINEKVINHFDCPVIPASFCRIIRIKPEIDSEYIYYWLQDMYEQGRTWGYQNQSTGLANFQFKIFAKEETVRLPDNKTQREIGHFLSTLDGLIACLNRTNGYLAA